MAYHNNCGFVSSDVVFTYNNNIQTSIIIFKKAVDSRLGSWYNPPIIKRNQKELVEEIRSKLEKAQQAQEEVTKLL